MLDRLKKLWPFVSRRHYAAERRRWQASEDAQYQWYTEARNQLADRLAGLVAERDAADFNAGRAWKAADELAEKVKAAQDAAAEADRGARLENGRANLLAVQLAEAKKESAKHKADVEKFSRRLVTLRRKLRPLSVASADEPLYMLP
jgi:chromosome segregation ATPase